VFDYLTYTLWYIHNGDVSRCQMLIKNVKSNLVFD